MGGRGSLACVVVVGRRGPFWMLCARIGRPLFDNHRLRVASCGQATEALDVVRAHVLETAVRALETCAERVLCKSVRGGLSAATLSPRPPQLSKLEAVQKGGRGAVTCVAAPARWDDGTLPSPLSPRKPTRAACAGIFFDRVHPRGDDTEPVRRPLMPYARG